MKSVKDFIAVNKIRLSRPLKKVTIKCRINFDSNKF